MHMSEPLPESPILGNITFGLSVIHGHTVFATFLAEWTK